MSQYQPELNLSALDGENGFSFRGPVGGAEVGFSVSAAGDVNGDGIADILLSAHETSFSSDFSREGAAYVVYGGAANLASFDALDGALDGAIELSGITASLGFQVRGEAPGDYAGKSVHSAGDVNGDGIDDIIVGAYGADNAHGGTAGAAYVVFGSASGLGATITLSSLNGTNGFKIIGGESAGRAGTGVSSAGDINGDGIGDILVGAPMVGLGTMTQGATYVIYGHTAPFSAAIDLASMSVSTGFRINAETGRYGAGCFVATAGDVNGDHVDDIIIGTLGNNSTFPGTSYVVFGKTTGFGALLNLSGLDGTNGFQINGERNGDHCGAAVSTAGDVNGDGFADLIVGASTGGTNGYGGSSNAEGASYVIFGKSTPFSAEFNVSSLNGANGFKISGEEFNDRSGDAVAGGGDFNGDGFDDLIVGADFASPGGVTHFVAGATYIVFGKADGFTANFLLTAIDGNNGIQLDGVGSVDQSGFSASFADDVNGDGFDDILVGAPGADPNGDASGTGYLIFGSGPNEAVTRTGTAIANTIHGGDFDDSLSGLGGDDHLLGHDGNDILIGGTGDDALDGGAGADTASYADATGGVTVNLSILTAQAVGGGQGSDTLTSIENVIGSGFNDTLIGNANANTFTGTVGNDIYNGGNGSDTVTFAGVAGGVTVDLHLTSAQLVSAGQGNDTFLSIENLVGTAFTDHLSGSNASNVLAGGGGNDVLDGAGGNDILDGGVGNDIFILSGGGNDTAFGGASSGDDTFDFGAALTNLDTVDGGGGADTIRLNGDYSANVMFRNATMVNVESIVVGTGFNYSLTIADANIAQNKTLTVDGSALDAGHGLTLDASREKDGFVVLTGGLGGDKLSGGRRADTITGGDGDDTLTGGQGADAIDGGAGTDTFVFTKARDPAGTKHDTVTSFDAQADHIDLAQAVTGVDDPIASGTLSAAFLTADLKVAADKTHLLANHAVLFTPDAGDLAGTTFLIVDLDGRAGYSAAHDLVIQLNAAAHLDALVTATFT